MPNLPGMTDHYIPFFIEWEGYFIYAAFVVFSFGLITLLRVPEIPKTGGKLQFTRWKAFIFGDTLCIPFFLANSAYIINDYWSEIMDAVISQVWVFVVLYLACLVLSIFMEMREHKSGNRDKRITRLLSQLIHTFVVFPVAGMLIAWSAIALVYILIENDFSMNELGWLLLMNSVGSMVGYAALFILDDKMTSHEYQSLDNR